MHRPPSRSAARAAVLVTALLATVALGGGAAAIQGVGTPTPAPTPAPSVSATPSEAAQQQRLPDAPQEVEQSPEVDEPGKGPKADTRAKAGKDPTPGRGPKPGKGPGGARGPAPEVAFTCDPSKSHGENVSAYVHSLPKGQGRGRQVSQVARSDCGKAR